MNGDDRAEAETAPAVTGIDQLAQRDTASPLDIITAADAPGAAQNIISSDQLRALVDDARTRYDLVVIDSPPVLAFVDARILSQIADSTVLVVRWRRTPRAMVRSAIKAFANIWWACRRRSDHPGGYERARRIGRQPRLHAAQVRLLFPLNAMAIGARVF